jgi:hypothetical protein
LHPFPGDDTNRKILTAAELTMIKPSDILGPPMVMMCGLGQIADGGFALATLTRYRSHIHEKLQFAGETEADDVAWFEPAAPISTLCYENRDMVYRASRTHSRLPLAGLALARIADGVVAVCSLGFMHSSFAVDLQFSGWWQESTEPWFRVNAAVAVQRDEQQPVLTYIGVDKR